MEEHVEGSKCIPATVRSPQSISTGYFRMVKVQPHDSAGASFDGDLGLTDWVDFIALILKDPMLLHRINAYELQLACRAMEDFIALSSEPSPALVAPIWQRKLCRFSTPAHWLPPML